ncbi:MAG TPA: 4-alpha-glucanotransferase [Acidimicrobiales bacterium]|nr:4-alpha-glucanotransferase [Acidimicrobiales bacterium]
MIRPIAEHDPSRAGPSPDAWGVVTRYRDASGEWHEPPTSTVEAALAAMGAEEGEPPATSPVLFVRPGRQGSDTTVDCPTDLTTEDGATVHLNAGERLPADLDLGYHTLTDRESGDERTLVVTPGTCRLPTNAPTWGWTVQLYAARSRDSWGIGDLGDLARLTAWAAGELGAGLVLINPLHAAVPVVPQDASPYYPSSRRFRNPLYLRVEEVPGAGAVGADLEELAARGRALNDDRRIDRNAVFELKMEALRALWARFDGDPAFDRWSEAGGAALEAYATYCVLSEDHGRPWPKWPEDLRHPHSPAVRSFRERHRRRVDFHRWLQWLIDRQLEAASDRLPVVHDLAVGFDPDGADGWEWQDVLAPGMSVGAPPDEFNTRGQDWGLPPFDPWRLRARSYGPFVETVGAAFRHAGGLRLDHVMGLFRLFWVPHGSGAQDGTYVRYPSADLLDIVALESHRASAYVVGEDLGTVEPEVRDEMAARDMLSYRLLWFEEKHPSGFPARALAAVTTHDLPTVAGLWTGSDLEAQKDAGMEPNERGITELRSRVASLTGKPDDAAPEEVVAATYAALGQAPSLLLAASLDDGLAVEERPNMPGTLDEWPNWSIALPLPLEEVEGDPRPRAIADALGREDRQ